MNDEPTILTDRDRDKFLDMIANPPKPNEALKGAVKVAPPGRRLSFEEALKRTHERYGEVLQRLADEGD